MSIVRVQVANDVEWFIGIGELTIPAKSLEAMSAEDIGKSVLALVPDINEIKPFLQGGYSFDTLEDFRIFKAKCDQDAKETRERQHRIRQVRSELQRDYYRTFVVIGKRDGFRCAICGSLVDLQVDHVLPIAKGGDNNLGNLQLLCRKCNGAKSDSLSLE